MQATTDSNQTDQQTVAQLVTGRAQIEAELRKVIIGQKEVIEELLIALLAGGHCLITGAPGLAKTLLVKSLAQIFHLKFQRIQFTPDLMPADITGTEILQDTGGERKLAFVPGPVFANMILADEINRTPPKTQAALLEAMEERQVSVEGEARPLPEPFLVVATQNPVEYEGTYPLPEAQLDRFLLKILVDYPSAEEEATVLARHDEGLDPHDLASVGVTPVAGAADLAAARRQVAAVTVDARVRDYIVAVVRATRESPSVSLGASPRGATMLLWSAKAWAWLAGKDFVTPDEVKAVARPALRHRIQLRPEVELEGSTADGVLTGILNSVPVPR